MRRNLQAPTVAHPATFSWPIKALVSCLAAAWGASLASSAPYVNEAGGVSATVEHLGLPTAGARRAPARGHLQASGG